MIARSPVLLVAALSAFGCKAPEPAPEDLGQLTLYLFRHFDGDGEEMKSGTLELEEYLATLDLTGNVNDRSVAPPILKGEDLGSLQMPDGASASAQVPVAVSGLSRHDLDANLGLAGESNQVCIESDTTKYYHREYLTDLACFLDGSCERLETANEVRKETIVSKLWYDLYKDYFRVELEDGRTVVFARSWIEEVAYGDGGNSSLDQSFTIETWIPDSDDGSTTQRFYSMWSSVTLSGVGDDMYASMAKSGLDEGFQNADDFLDGVMCGNDRDREYDRE